MKIFMNQNIDRKAQVTIEAFLNLIKNFQKLSNYNTVISFFRQAFLRQQYPIFNFFVTPEESLAVYF